VHRPRDGDAGALAVDAVLGLDEGAQHRLEADVVGVAIAPDRVGQEIAPERRATRVFVPPMSATRE
jgi:hypothetical protein